jgi:hypothetical protein
MSGTDRLNPWIEWDVEEIQNKLFNADQEEEVTLRDQGNCGHSEAEQASGVKQGVSVWTGFR